MINITNKMDCCGCWACVQRCPKQCIMMNEDEEGFLYPKVNTDLCIECGLCEDVCPIIHQSDLRSPLKVYAAKNPNEEIRIKSSSGGIFTMLAEKIINDGGIVFGARFNEKWEVIHDYAKDGVGVELFRGSKYVQSQIIDSYKCAEKFLKEGKKVLFSGTPCQIAGLNNFLRKEYANLLSVDVACHGVPSPKVWREYLKSISLSANVVDTEMNILPTNIDSSIERITFRDKKYGWKSFGLGIYIKSVNSSNECQFLYESMKKNIFLQGFLKDLYLRPSCHACPARKGKSKSDITIADYWGISSVIKNFDDDKGVSLILINTEKGDLIYDELHTYSVLTKYEQAIVSNPCLEHSVAIPNYRQKFWNEFNAEGVNVIPKICAHMRPTMFLQAFRIVKIILKRILKLIK